MLYYKNIRKSENINNKNNCAEIHLRENQVNTEPCYKIFTE